MKKNKPAAQMVAMTKAIRKHVSVTSWTRLD